jgi:hypothetical protein
MARGQDAAVGTVSILDHHSVEAKVRQHFNQRGRKEQNGCNTKLLRAQHIREN